MIYPSREIQPHESFREACRLLHVAKFAYDATDAYPPTGVLVHRRRSADIMARAVRSVTELVAHVYARALQVSDPASAAGKRSAAARPDAACAALQQRGLTQPYSHQGDMEVRGLGSIRSLSHQRHSTPRNLPVPVRRPMLSARPTCFQRKFHRIGGELLSSTAPPTRRPYLDGDNPDARRAGGCTRYCNSNPDAAPGIFATPYALGAVLRSPPLRRD